MMSATTGAAPGAGQRRRRQHSPRCRAAPSPQVTYSARAAVLLHAAPLLAAAALLRGARGMRAGALAAHAALYFAGLAYAMAAPAALGALLVVITGALHRSCARRQRLAACWYEVWRMVRGERQSRFILCPRRCWALRRRTRRPRRPHGAPQQASARRCSAAQA